MTIRQLAEELGLSKSAVAYALRGSPEVSPETRDWVQKRARELGYAPNPVASAFLQQVRSQGAERYRANLAFLLPGTSITSGSRRTDVPSDAAFLKCLRKGAQERAEELGYGLDEVCIGGYTSVKLTRMLLARGTLGVLIAPLTHAIGHMTLDWSKFAAAAFGFSMVRPNLHRLVHNHLQGIRTALRVCQRKGYQRIGLALSNDSDSRSSRQWSAAYLGLQRTLSPADRVPPFIVPLAEYTAPAICRWIAETKPQAIIVHASGCIPDLPAHLRELGWQVPCVVLDREPADPYAGIDQRFTLSGRLLIDLLSSQILHNQRGIPEPPIVSMLDGVWVDHPSLPMLRAPAAKRKKTRSLRQTNI